MKKWMLVVVIACLLMVPLGTAHSGKHNRPQWLPKVWWAIGMCETHLNWRHNRTTYEGAFGFHYDSWDRFRPTRYPKEAYLAKPRQQLYVARQIHRRYGFTGWGCYGNSSYYYWLRRAP